MTLEQQLLCLYGVTGVSATLIFLFGGWLLALLLRVERVFRRYGHTEEARGVRAFRVYCFNGGEVRLIFVGLVIALIHPLVWLAFVLLSPMWFMEV